MDEHLSSGRRSQGNMTRMSTRGGVDRKIVAALERSESTFYRLKTCSISSKD